MPDQTGIYVHVPFGSAICNYCNFNRGLHDDGLRRRYVDAVVAHLAREGDGSPVDTIYFGGGTPSLLAVDEVARIVAQCALSFTLADNREVTLEANPESIDPRRLSGWRAAGVNRLSLGVQSFRDEELQRLGRLHSVARARAAVNEARAAGFDNISLDLMMWLPAQSLVQWQESVEALIGVGPEHASLYLAGRDVRSEVIALSPGDRAAEALFMGLRLREGVDIVGIRDRYGIDVRATYGDALVWHVRAGLIELGERRWTLTERGRLLANDVMAVFV